MSTTPPVLSLNRTSHIPDLKIECTVSAFPKADVTWKKLDGPLPIERFTQEASGALVIKEASYEDSGTYLCTASNELGTDHANFTITVYGNLTIFVNPSPPYFKSSA